MSFTYPGHSSTRINHPRFRIGLLTEAAECLFSNELAVAKILLRDYVNATMGFRNLLSEPIRSLKV